jgi:hypothetical protein
MLRTPIDSFVSLYAKGSFGRISTASCFASTISTPNDTTGYEFDSRKAARYGKGSENGTAFLWDTDKSLSHESLGETKGHAEVSVWQNMGSVHQFDPIM